MHSEGHSTWCVRVCVCVCLLHFLPPHNNVSNSTQNEQDFFKGVFLKMFCYLPTGLSWPFYYSMHIQSCGLLVGVEQLYSRSFWNGNLYASQKICPPCNTIVQRLESEEETN